MAEVLIKNGMIVTVDDQWSLPKGDVLCRDGRIVQVGGDAVPTAREYEVIDATGCLVLPGFVQTHVHTCQTLARGRADDLQLLDWLKKIVWPYEGSLEEEDAAASARLSAAELLLGGTTCIQDMATVHHTDAIFAALAASGIRATCGKAMMDAGADVPPSLRESTKASLDESLALCRRWHGAENGRLRYAFAPRFVLSCSESLLRDVVAAAADTKSRIHTHASENRDECAAVKTERGLDNIVYFDKIGMTGSTVGIAHCVWLSDEERSILARTGTRVLHCPSSNLKLASGVAPIPELVERGVHVSLGADGAPCNNNLDMFEEMRLAALVHKPRVGPRAMPAQQVVRMATRGGAEALGLGDELGSLEPGKRADVIVVDTQRAHIAPTDSPYSALVYSAHATDVRDVIVDGKIVVRDRGLSTIDVSRAVADGRARARRIFAAL